LPIPNTDKDSEPSAVPIHNESALSLRKGTLITALDGAAQIAFQSATAEQKASYDSIKSFLQESFRPANYETFLREKIYNCKQQAKEPCQVFLWRIKSLTDILNNYLAESAARSDTPARRFNEEDLLMIVGNNVRTEFKVTLLRTAPKTFAEAIDILRK